MSFRPEMRLRLAAMGYNRVVGASHWRRWGKLSALLLVAQLCSAACGNDDIGGSGADEDTEGRVDAGGMRATGDASAVDASANSSAATETPDAGVEPAAPTEVEIPVEIVDGADDPSGASTSGDTPPADPTGMLPGIPDLFSTCGASNSDPGVTWFRRLTAWQLDNTLRDLFGVDSLLRWIPADAQVGQFYNNYPSGMTTDLVEDYAELARSVARSLKPRMAEFSPCDLEAAGDDPACAERFISEFGLRVYRRPLTLEDVAWYVTLYTQAQQLSGQASTGFEWVVRTMLQSPHFLYHSDANFDFPKPQATPLDSFGMASRLSYFLWQSTPDDALLDAAAAGELLDDATLQRHTLRLLEDPRAERAIRSFFVQWLDLQRLPEQTKVDERWNPQLAWDMVDEVATLGSDVILRGDGSLATLFNTTQSAASDELLALYGTSREGDAVRVALDPSERAGLLTRAAFLSRFAPTDRSSPSNRGLGVQERLLCVQLPDDTVRGELEPYGDYTTTRQWLEAQTSDPGCMGCHVFIDPIGFNLENYDAIGAYRATEDGEVIDSTGEIAELSGDRWHVQSAFELSALLPSLRSTNECAVVNWWRFALGRSGDSLDGASMSAMQANFEASDGNLLALMQCLVVSPAFRSVRWEGSTVR